ncbi:hypothetical protein PR202_gb11469 [Eleusine coracana subsp. coracana]|uniref:Uncharacterized protein n=1 Tax=Eleusine coracana subsp. coracana TaxID=191504 RepID=A0AAV5ENJ5_ELECO|nr:hypothetical protein PR202_gb11469 [Eleusine coracana subsp. coracana]
MASSAPPDPARGEPDSPAAQSSAPLAELVIPSSMASSSPSIPPWCRAPLPFLHGFKLPSLPFRSSMAPSSLPRSRRRQAAALLLAQIPASPMGDLDEGAHSTREQAGTGQGDRREAEQRAHKRRRPTGGGAARPGGRVGVGADACGREEEFFS